MKVNPLGALAETVYNGSKHTIVVSTFPDIRWGHWTQVTTVEVYRRNHVKYFEAEAIIHSKDLADPSFRPSYKEAIKVALKKLQPQVSEEEEFNMLKHILFRKGKRINKKYGTWTKKFNVWVNVD